MNKGELAAALAEELSISKAEAGKVVDAFVGVISAAVARGESVQLTGFGTFSVSERAARSGRNPATGKAIEIPAAKVPKFTAGKALKDAVNG